MWLQGNALAAVDSLVVGFTPLTMAEKRPWTVAWAVGCPRYPVSGYFGALLNQRPRIGHASGHNHNSDDRSANRNTKKTFCGVYAASFGGFPPQRSIGAPGQCGGPWSAHGVGRDP